MKVLVIGSGGREHALVWKIRQSPRVSEIYCAPGNGGIAQIAKCVNIKADDIVGLLSFAKEHKIGLTVVGPEVPLVLGIVDEFEKAGLKAFGPSRAAARLEGSKAYAKSFMKRHKIPTAEYRDYDNYQKAVQEAVHLEHPLVIKADGLAAGKGVVISTSALSTAGTIQMMMVDHQFGSAGNQIVIEGFLSGEEASILAVADGVDFIILESSQDHKRIFDNDQGPNTGGMGAYSPAPVVTPALMKQIADTVIKPAIDGMRKDGSPFKGILYAGIMVTEQGPKVLEFNTRFGDPETQAVLPRLKSDIVDMMLASVEGRLSGMKLEWDSRACVCVVMAAGGYPGDYSSGKEIKGLGAVPSEAVVFHAGTKKDGNKVLTSGGRVLGVTALGAGIARAIESAYGAAGKISFDGCQYRKDIGRKALNRN